MVALYVGKLPVTSGFLAQRASNAEKVSLSERHHATMYID